MKYVYATLYATSVFFIALLVVTGNPFQTSPSPLGIFIILGATTLTFAGIVIIMTWSAKQSTDVIMMSGRATRAIRAQLPQADRVDYFIEMEEGAIFFLSAGDSLTVFALPEGFTPDSGPLFPNTDFTIYQDSGSGEIMGLGFHGTHIVPETLVVANEDRYMSEPLMKNGAFTLDMNYEDVKQRILGL